MPAEQQRAWIETTHHSLEQRTEWRVVVDGEVLQSGNVTEDLAGTTAYDIAYEWAVEHDVGLVGWKHAIDRGVNETLLRSRTTTDKAAPLRLYGYVKCEQGGREAVAVTPQQMHDLEAGVLPCPVCGEGCGAKLQPAAAAKHAALLWNGARWHGHAER
jgi:hypothetical protein